MSRATDTPRVSIVIPNYNYGRFIGAALRSALAQEHVDVDVTVVDDGSTDDSVTVVERIARRDSRVRLVQHQTNRGHIATFNHALESATAERLVKLDADDLLPPGALARSAALMDSDPSIGFVYGRVASFTDQPPPLAETSPMSWSVWDGWTWIGTRVRRGHNVIRQPEVMIRRSALQETAGHSADIPEASDFHLWLSLAALGKVARVNGPVQGLYRVHAGSMQRTIHAGLLSDLRARARVFDLFFDGRELSAAHQWMRSASDRRIACDALWLAHRAYDVGEWRSQPVDGFLEIAIEHDPGIARSLGWRLLRARRALAECRFEALARRTPGALAREIGHRARWHRWNRTGL